MREVRCFPGQAKNGIAPANRWSGDPQFDGFERFWTIRAMVEGVIDSQTGYLCDIRQLDQLLRHFVVPTLEVDRNENPKTGLPAVLRNLFPRACERWSSDAALVAMELAVSPYLIYRVDKGDWPMVSVTQSFEFCASHRLNAASLTAEENLRTFGKCSNPKGHGHNYILEVTVSGEPDEATGVVVELPGLNETVRLRVLEDFDHKNLNEEVPEFAAINPSVENIARVIWNRLEQALQASKLDRIRVWETAKTYAEYHGRD